MLGDLLAEFLPEVRYQAPEGTYLAWLDCRELEPRRQPRRVFPRQGVRAGQRRVRVRGGGAGHVRLNFATPARS